MRSRHPLLLVFILAAGIPMQAQEPPPLSSVQFINATSLEAVDLNVHHGRKYKNLQPGSRVPGGAFSRQDWKLSFHPSGREEKPLTAHASLSLSRGESRTVVLIGDARLVHEQGESPALRSKILDFSSAFSDGERPNRLIVVNGHPELPLEITPHAGIRREVPPMSSVSIAGLPTTILVRAAIGKKHFDLPMEFLPPTQSVVVCFYLRAGQPDYAVMPQSDLEEQ